jgi:class 3 adenylate cyclase
LVENRPEELGKGIWFQEEARAERLANLIRFIYTLIWIFTTALSAGTQPFSANLSNIGLGALWCLFALGYHFYLAGHAYRRPLKYLSTTYDIFIIAAMLYTYHFGMGYNTSLKSITFMVFFYVLILTTLRFKYSLSIYAGALTLVVYLGLLAFASFRHHVEFGTMAEEFTTQKVNLVQQIYRLTFLVTITALMLILVKNIHRLVHLRVDEAHKLFTEKIQREKTQNLFERYFTTKIARYLADHPPDLGGKAQKVTVMICDLRGFTRLSEDLGPAKSVKLLNNLFEGLVEIVFKYQGTLDKFLGDGMLIAFGIPEPRPDDAFRAVRAAWEMVEQIRLVGQHVNLEMGVAINTGDVIFGNIGSRQRMEFTIIGDTVNTCSRMEHLNKQFNTHILISESTCRELDNSVCVRPLPEVEFRGKTGSHRLYEVEAVLG